VTHDEGARDSRWSTGGWAGGVHASGRWRFKGIAPHGATRVEIRGSSATYVAECHDGRWEVELAPVERAAIVTVEAIASDGEVLARDRCVIAAPEPRRGLAGWVLRRIVRRSRTAGRGTVTYGPY
jgi:hypothetical protein